MTTPSSARTWAERRENFWRWLEIFPGNVILLAIGLMPIAVFLLLAAAKFCLLLAGGDPYSWAGSLPTYLLLLIALLLFPGKSPLWRKIVALGLLVWLGGAPAAWGYLTLAAAAARRPTPVIQACWRIVSWLPERAIDLLRRLRHWQAPPLAPAKTFSGLLLIVILLLSVAGLRFRDNLATIDTQGWAPADAREYETLARQIVARQPLQLNHSAVFPAPHPIPTYANRTPGYPAFLALVYHLTPGNKARQGRVLLKVQILLDVAAGVLLFFALRRALPNWAALLALLLWMAYVPAVMASGMLLAESFAAFLLCLLLFCTLEVKSPWWWAAAGLLAGAIALTRPELSGLVVLLGLVLWLRRASSRRRLAYLGLMLFCFIAALTPWWVRNYSIFHKFVPSSTVGGFNFWAGNYLPYHGIVRPHSYERVADILAANHIKPEDELALDKALWRAGVKNVGHYLVTRPWAYGGLLSRKLRETWSLPWIFDLGPFAPINLRAPLLFLCFLGSGVALLHGRKLLPLLGLPIYQTLAHVVSYGHEGRYLLPVLPMVFGLTLLGLWFCTLPAAPRKIEVGKTA